MHKTEFEVILPSHHLAVHGCAATANTPVRNENNDEACAIDQWGHSVVTVTHSNRIQVRR